MNVGKLQSEFRESEPAEPFYYCSLAMMETGLIVDSFFEEDMEGVKYSLTNVARFTLMSAASANVELEGEVEEVESYENIDTETIIFMLMSDISKLGKLVYEPEGDKVEEGMFLNCMRDIVALEKSLDMDIESELMGAVKQKS